jgi:hypothetical protein
MPLEPIGYPDVYAAALDIGVRVPDPPLLLIRHLHLRHELAEHLPHVALCIAAEIAERGGTIEEWEVTFDQQEYEDDPDAAWWAPPMTEVASSVTCPDCQEWMHA